MIHDRIRRARVLRGLTLDALAQQLGDISKQALNKFEKGTATPNSTRILQLSQALDVRPEYFFRSDEVSLTPLEFRKLARMPRYRQQQVEQLMREHLERYLALERCFDAADIRIAPPPPASISIDAVEAAEAAAQSVRVRWAIGQDAIVNLTELLEEHGVKVAMIDGSDDFDGACASTHDGQHVLVALNRHRPGERVRFTAAHELGHWLLDLPASWAEATREQACHRFAGALLYSKERVLADFGPHRRRRIHPGELLSAKRKYGISIQLALRRLKDLDLLDDAGYRGAFIELGKAGWRSAEPEPLLPEQPLRLETLVYRGLAEDLFSLSRAAEFLRRPVGTSELSLLTREA